MRTRVTSFGLVGSGSYSAVQMAVMVSSCRTVVRAELFDIDDGCWSRWPERRRRSKTTPLRHEILRFFAWGALLLVIEMVGPVIAERLKGGTP